MNYQESKNHAKLNDNFKSKKKKKKKGWEIESFNLNIRLEIWHAKVLNCSYKGYNHSVVVVDI